MIYSYSGPFLIFDLDEISNNVEELSLLGKESGVELIGAMKALPLPELIEVTYPYLKGFDVSNLEELSRLNNWWSKKKSRKKIPFVSLVGPAQSIGIAPNVRFVETLVQNLDNLSQFEITRYLNECAENLEIGLRVCVQSKHRNLFSRFGVLPDDIPNMLCNISKERIFSLHTHVEGDSGFDKSHVHSASVLRRVCEENDLNHRMINLGGGFREQSTQQLKRIFTESNIICSSEQVIFEPGSYLTRLGGYVLCKIINSIYRQDINSLVINVDLSPLCHSKWSKLKLEKVIGFNVTYEKLTIFGPTCYEGDLIGTFECEEQYKTSNSINTGGFLLFSGLSGYSISFNTAFNGVPRAKVITIGKSIKLH